MNKTIKLSLTVIALVSSLQAENKNTIELKPLTITSTAIKTDELKATESIEVYTAEDIEKAHVQNVYEFLNSQTSVTTMSSYGNPFTQLIDMRGYGTSNGNQNVVITLNGRKLNNIDNVPQLLSSISPASINRLEIIKSSGIVVGGDGANAGVINIITKRNNNKEIALYGGTYGILDGYFYLGHSDDKLSVSASGEIKESGGIRYIDSNGNKDENSLKTATFDFTYYVSDALEMRLGASSTRIDVNYAGYLTKDGYNSDTGQEGAFSVHQAFDTDAISAGIGYFINNNFTLKFDANHEKKTSKYIPTTTFSDYTYDSAKISLDFDNNILSVATGIDAFYGDLDSAGDTTSKNNLAAFVMSELYLGKTTLKAGYRYERVSYEYNSPVKNITQDNSLSGVELGLNYELGKKESLFFNYSHAYQAPNIDNFFKTDYSNWPILSKAFNSFIEPMKSDNFTFGYNQINEMNKFKISVYYANLKNEIYLHKPDYKNTNLDKSHKYGLDIYDKWIVSTEFNLILNYNYVQAVIDEEKEGVDNYADKELPGVSNHNIKATFSYLPNKNTTLALTHVYRSEAYAADDFNNNFSQKQDAFNSTDLSASYVKDYWEVFAKINNLFNQKNGLWIQDDAIYPINFTTTAMAGFKLKF